MLFNTWEYAVFLLVVLPLYWSVGKRTQNVLLLVASYVFYGWWDWRFLGLIALSTVIDYTVARRMHDSADPSRRKHLLWISVGTNLGILGFFKYFNFFTGSTIAALQAFGFEAHAPTLEIVLPVGISFYTFQTMAYTIDVYRGRLEPTRDFGTFALYVCFFPQLVAGPIERAQHLLPQFSRARNIDAARIGSGFQLILMGLFRKVVIGDFASAEVDAAFEDPGSVGSLVLLRGVLMFALQIYGDFAGYSDIARGSSRLLGIELMENFAQPYFSTDIASFWRRWHISLSTWLRDYLYIPLGGNRGGDVATYRNLMLTMLLGGLWHGAAWTYVVWGAIHGVALSVHRLALRGRTPSDRPWLTRSPVELGKTITSWSATMAVVLFAWVFFRAPNIDSAFDVLRGLFAVRGGLEIRLLLLPLALMAAVMVLDVPIWVKKDHNVMSRYPWWLRGALYAGMILSIAILRPNTDVPFIYFQF